MTPATETAAFDLLTLDTWPPALTAAFQAVPQSVLQTAPQTAPRITQWIVGLSGGFDSSLLLRLCQVWLDRYGQPIWSNRRLSAIHVDHQLHPDSPQWAQHCQQLCDRLGVPLIQCKAELQPDGHGLEAAARDARYQAFARHLSAGDVLLLAHHAGDQAETFLYRLMRGSGLEGLAAMPVTRQIGAGQLCRPLLGFPQDQLKQWGSSLTAVINDPSNDNHQFDRNFLRHAILPRLKARWPAAEMQITQAAQTLQDARQMLDQLASLDAQVAKGEAWRLAPPQVASAKVPSLCLAPLMQLDPPRQRNLLRWWLRQFQPLAPSHKHLGESLQHFLAAEADRHPLMQLAGGSIRRFRHQLHWVSDLEAQPPATSELRWQLATPCAFAGRRLCARQAIAQPDEKLLKIGVTELRVSTRQGGETFRTHPNGPEKQLKTWLQEQQIAPWLRYRLPLFRPVDAIADQTLIGIAGLWLHPDYCAAPGEAGWHLSW